MDIGLYIMNRLARLGRIARMARMRMGWESRHRSVYLMRNGIRLLVLL